MSLSPEVLLRRVNDRLEIRELVDLYGFVMDELSLPGIRRIFTDDAEFSTPDKHIYARSLDGLVEMFQGRFGVNGTSFHYFHGVITRFDDSNPDVAYGLVSGHVELSRQGVPLIGALRYEDEYRRTEAGWKIRRRVLSYGYYMDVREYPEAIHGHERVRIYGDRRSADWPVALRPGSDPSWFERFL